jgi:hypothetical protein
MMTATAEEQRRLAELVEAYRQKFNVQPTTYPRTEADLIPALEEALETGVPMIDDRPEGAVI